MTVSTAKREAIRRYDDKTYKRFMLYLRIDDDREIIDDLENSREQGLSLREWLSDLFLRANK